MMKRCNLCIRLYQRGDVIADLLQAQSERMSAGGMQAR